MHRVFNVKSHLDLVEEGIKAIEVWTETLGHEAMSDLLIEIIPAFRSYLDGETLELLEESAKNKTSGTVMIISKHLGNFYLNLIRPP